MMLRQRRKKATEHCHEEQRGSSPLEEDFRDELKKKNILTKNPLRRRANIFQRSSHGSKIHLRRLPLNVRSLMIFLFATALLSCFLIGGAHFLKKINAHVHSNGSGTRKPLYGNLTKGIYKFHSKLLGFPFAQTLDYVENDWIVHSPQNFSDYWGNEVHLSYPFHQDDEFFARKELLRYGPRRHHENCFRSPLVDEYQKLEQEKQLLDASQAQKFREEERKLFYQKGSDKEQAIDYHSKNDLWVWRAPGFFSAKESDKADHQKHILYDILRKSRSELQRDDHIPNVKFLGVFWHPPGGVSEWQTHKFKAVPHPWRLYYTRLYSTMADIKEGVNHGMNLREQSGMHILGGSAGLEDAVLERLEGAFPTGFWLNETDLKRQVWAVPDEDKMVTIHRLNEAPPFQWSCAVSRSVHRLSVVFSLGDEDVERIIDDLPHVEK